MSKIFDALKNAEKERSGDPSTRYLARAAEEQGLLRAEISACREQLAALATKVAAVPQIDPATIDELARRVAELAAQQERAAQQPQPSEDATRAGQLVPVPPDLEAKLEAFAA